MSIPKLKYISIIVAARNSARGIAVADGASVVTHQPADFAAARHVSAHQPDVLHHTTIADHAEQAHLVLAGLVDGHAGVGKIAGQDRAADVAARGRNGEFITAHQDLALERCGAPCLSTIYEIIPC